MSTSKDTRGDEAATAELSVTVQLAVQAFDGRQLSDEELELLCDAALSDFVSSSGKGAKA